MNMTGKLMVIILVVAAVLIFPACQKSVAENSGVIPAVAFSPEQTPSSSPPPDSPIRKIDFENFSYPKTADYINFKLKNGEKSFGCNEGIGLGKIEYAEVTGDKKEDAILFMSIQTGGSAVPHLIYIYTLESGKPKLAWGFMAGDRAEGGLKRTYAENNLLIVETFGDNKFENEKWNFNLPEKYDRGLCCPIVYTKIRFNWNGEKFVVQGTPELLDYGMNKEMSK